MLFLLTGDVQIGKTTWLEALCADLSAAGACVAGVTAPGQWVPRPEGQPGGKHGVDGAGRFEKLGIDNVLWPQGERVAFARRRDLAQAGQAFAEGSQAKAAQLVWAISDEAIAQVNRHFSELARQAETLNGKTKGPAPERQKHSGAAEMGPNDAAGLGHRATATSAGFAELSINETSAYAGAIAPGALLVVDELGRLELMLSCGLTEAMSILDDGPTRAFPHAIVVVRDMLADEARRRFEPAWGELCAIGTTDEARRRIFTTVLGENA